MTTVVTAMWAHGNAIIAEHPEHILALDYRGWGPEFQLERETQNWFHLAVPTPPHSRKPAYATGPDFSVFQYT